MSRPTRKPYVVAGVIKFLVILPSLNVSISDWQRGKITKFVLDFQSEARSKAETEIKASRSKLFNSLLVRDSNCP